MIVIVILHKGKYLLSSCCLLLILVAARGIVNSRHHGILDTSQRLILIVARLQRQKMGRVLTAE